MLSKVLTGLLPTYPLGTPLKKWHLETGVCRRLVCFVCYILVPIYITQLRIFCSDVMVVLNFLQELLLYFQSLPANGRMPWFRFLLLFFLFLLHFCPLFPPSFHSVLFWISFSWSFCIVFIHLLLCMMRLRLHKHTCMTFTQQNFYWCDARSKSRALLYRNLKLRLPRAIIKIPVCWRYVMEFNSSSFGIGWWFTSNSLKSGCFR